jgi:hypothetical protein
LTAHLTRSDSEGLCAVYPKQWMRTICCGMAVKMRMLGVSVRKIKALTVKMATAVLISKGRIRHASCIKCLKLIVKYFAWQAS